MTELADKTCVPCKGDVPPLKGAELEELSRQVPGWEVVDEHHLRREFRFKNFREALEFVNRVGMLAEEQAHHPDIDFGWAGPGSGSSRTRYTASPRATSSSPRRWTGSQPLRSAPPGIDHVYKRGRTGQKA